MEKANTLGERGFFELKSMKEEKDLPNETSQEISGLNSSVANSQAYTEMKIQQAISPPDELDMIPKDLNFEHQKKYLNL